MKTLKIIFAAVLIINYFGCQKPYNISDLPIATIQTVGDTSYIEINPPIYGFNNPTAIYAGGDQMLYVADTDNNRIVQLNEAGIVMGSREILRPMAIAQDLRLDLLVTGLIYREETGDTIGAIFRLKMYNLSKDYPNHDISRVRMDTIYREDRRPYRRFRGIAPLINNQYLVVRDGPDNTSFVDPDSRVLWFWTQTIIDTIRDTSGTVIDLNLRVRDRMVTPLGDLATRSGSGVTDILRPTGIATFPNSNDFVIIQSSVGGTMIYGAIWMVYKKSYDFEGWLPKFTVQNEFLRPNRFVEPSAVAIDRSRLDIFIVDSALDSVVIFNRNGLLKPESFGNSKLISYGSAPMKNPKGVTHLTRTLYISDSGNNLIRRFRLSTER